MTPSGAGKSRVDRQFERLYRKHAAEIYRYAYAVLRNQADAEDATQTTFLNAYRALERGERPEKPQNWLIAIAHNVCRQRFRQQSRRPQEVEFSEGVDAAAPPGDGPSADDIRGALGQLTFNQRAALVMRELEGRSYEEIAQVLAVSVSAVETLLFRARRALREQLEGTLSCSEAELALSKQLDGRLALADRRGLRAHLRSCPECARLARRLRAQRSAIRGILYPLPASLAAWSGGGVAAGGSAATGAGSLAATVGVKAAALVAASALIAAAGYGIETLHPWPHGGGAAAASRKASAPRRHAAARVAVAVPRLA